MAFLFLLKKKSEGGISSGEMGVRSSTKTTSELRFLKLDCRGVNDVMGVPISVDFCCSVVFEVPVGVVCDEGGTFCPCFRKASSWDFSWGPSWLDNDASNFYVNTS
jgi:hypothetical protein